MAGYNCSFCGAAVSAAQTSCHECGQDIDWEQAVGRVSYVGNLSTGRRRRRPRTSSILLLGVVVAAVMAVMVFVGLWAVQQNASSNRLALGGEALQQFSQRIQQRLEDDGNADADGSVGASDALATAPTATSSTDLASDTPESPQVTPTPALAAVDLEAQLSIAQQHLDAGEWQAAISVLFEVRELDADFSADMVEEMLFQSQFAQAQSLEMEGDSDAALQALSQALAIRSTHADAVALWDAITLYQTGTAQMEVDWSAAIDTFFTLYALAPNYRDTPEQLFLAYSGHGDSLRYSDPCVAVERYQMALQLQRDPQLRAKWADARVRCTQTSEDVVAGPEPLPQLGGSDTVALAGQIAYTYFDELRTHHGVRFWQLEVGAPGTIVDIESLQPDVGPEGAIVVRSTTLDRYGITIYHAPGFVPERVTDNAGDNQPRWSPDGADILFVSTGRTEDRRSHLYIVDVLTGDLQGLGPGESADWSPDGRQIVYQGCDAQVINCGLWIVELATGGRRQLTSAPTDSVPRWSPDGRLIAFMSKSRSPSWDVFVADVESGNITYFALDAGIDGHPTWSPDGKIIAMLSNREGDWAVYGWSLLNSVTDRLLPVDGPLPDWRQASLDWTLAGP